MNFADGRPVELVDGTRCAAWLGPGMMMQMGRPRAVRERNGASHAVPAGSDVASDDHRDCLGSSPTLAAPDVKSAVAWRTFELNPMMAWA